MPRNRRKGVLADAPGQIWDQWANETDREYECFRLFLGQGSGKRTIRKTAEDVGLALSTMRRRSKAEANRPTWWARAKAYDFHMAERTELAIVETQADIIREHAQTWSMVRRLAVKSLEDMLATGHALTVDQALKYAELATKNERLALGEVTDRRGIKVKDATDADLAALERLLDQHEAS